MATRVVGNHSLSSLSILLRTQLRPSSYASNRRCHSVSQFEKSVQTRCKSRDLTVTEALGYFNSMLEMKPMPSIWTLNHLFGSLLKLNQFSTVLSMYTQLTRLRFCEFMPDISTLTVVIKCFFRLNAPKLALAVLGSALKRGVGYNSHTWSTLLDGLCKQGAMAEASELFEKIEKEDGLCNAYVYGAVINGFCKAGAYNRALDVFKRMLEKDGAKADIFNFNLILDCLCKDGLFGEALSLIDGMISCGVRPNVISYNSVIQGLCKSAKWSEVVRVLEKMKGEGVSPDIITFSSMLDARFKEGNTVAALHLAVVMAEKGRFSVDNKAFSSGLSGICGSTKTEEAAIMSEIMEDWDVYADTRTLNILLNGLFSGLMMLEARGLFEEMVERGKVDAVSFTIMINGYCLRGEMERAKEVFDRMEKNGVLGDTVAYNMLANRYLDVGRVDEALMILKELILKGLKPDGVTVTIFKNIRVYRRELPTGA